MSPPFLRAWSRRMVWYVVRHVMTQYRQRGLRHHDKPRIAALRQAAIGFQRTDQRLIRKFGVLRDVALEQTDLERLALRVRPFNAAQYRPAHPNCQQHGQCNFARFAPASFHKNQQNPALRRHDERHPEYAEQRRIARQRTVRHLRVTDGEPGETREQQAAQPFGQRPDRGHDQQDAQIRCRP